MASVSDGTSSTFLFGEKFVSTIGLGQFPEDSPAYDGDHLPASSRLAGPGLRLANSPQDLLADMFSFGSWHPAGVHFALVDGSVRLFSPETDTKVLGSLANRRDARVVELDHCPMRITTHLLAGYLIGMSLLCASGCSDSGHSGSGVVRFSDHEPVRAGSVEFRSIIGGKNRYASRIGDQGQFQLTDAQGRHGIADGEYEVVVVQIVITEDLALEQHTHGRTVPRRYADYYTSGLRVSVQSKHPQAIELVLSPE